MTTQNAFRYSHRVTYADCTMGNHVYYGRYLEILEAARGAFFRELGHPLLELQSQDMLFPVIECRLRYKTPARYDEVLAVELRVTTALGARLNLAYRILNEKGALVLEAETSHACTALNERPKRLPEELRVKLCAFGPA